MRPLLLGSISFAACLFLLTACAGTLSVGIESTPTIDPAPQATLDALVQENARLSAALATAIAPPPVPPSVLGRVAYIRGGDLWFAVLPEGPHQRLTIDGHNREPRWSPTGEWIAFRKDRTVLIERERPCEDPLRPGQPPCRESVSTFQQQLWLARRNGAAHHVINRGFTVERFAWSPRNDALAFVTDAGHLETLDPSTDIDLRLVTAQGTGRVGAIAWNPDGTQLAYEWVTDDTGGVSSGRAEGVWIVDTGGGKPVLAMRGMRSAARLVGWRDTQHVLVWQHPEQAVQPDDSVWLYSATLPAVAGGAQGAVLISSEPMLPRPDFLAVAPDPQHEIAVTLGAGLPTWTNKRIVAGSFRSPTNLAAILPAWAPNDQRLAFAAMPDASDLALGEGALAALMTRRIWLRTSLSEAAEPLTNDPRYRDERPLWSAQGGHILFARLTREGQASLWLVATPRGAPALVVDELTPAPDPVGNYGYVDWGQHYDWWRG